MDSAVAITRGQWLVEAVHGGDPAVTADDAVAELDAMITEAAGAEPVTTVLEWYSISVGHVVTQQRHDLAGMDAVAARATALRHRLPPGSTMDIAAQVMTASLLAVAAHSRGDVATRDEQVELVQGLRARIPADDPGAFQLRAGVDEMLSTFGPLRDAASAPAGSTTTSVLWEARLEPFRQAAAGPAASPTSRAMSLAELAGVELGAAEAGFPIPHLDDAVAHFRAAADVGGPHDPRRVLHLTGLGGALVRRFEQRRATTDLSEARRFLEEAQQLAGDPADPRWALLCQMLSTAHRLAGDLQRATQIGADGLRGHEWSVLLQADAAAATAVARNAADDAVHQARWCLGYGDTDGGIAALDAGRGLALKAATRFRDVEDLLAATGAAGLGSRWAAAVRTHGLEQSPLELRREVVRRLDGTEVWLSPPRAAEIRAALLRLDSDALVYLVAGDGDGEGGFAVVVPARGDPTLLPLPSLYVRPGADPERYIAAAASRDTRGAERADGSTDSDDSRFHQALEQVCDWAWTAAVQPLLDEHLPQAHPFTRGRTPRLVVVAMGELARVPWHAARHRHGQGVSYAIERAVFSTAVSARMYCDTAVADEIPITPSGLVIGDPDTGGAASQLPAALREAVAIRDAYYPRARYVGRDTERRPIPGRTGTADDVRAWLADRGLYAGAVLHAACHGVVRAGLASGDSSYLLLAGGEHLAAEEVIRILGTSRPDGLALVVLAACHTGVSGRGYDEAFSLATAFLAGGARTVVGAQWALPDSASSALMFMFHHFLRAQKMLPVDALRAAQLWMLRPDRVAPDAMPHNVRRVVQRGRPEDVVAWAGFTHSGR